MIPERSSILVATDLSQASVHTLRHVLSCIRDTKTQIRILHVCEPMSEDARVTLMMFMQNEGQRSSALRQRRHLIQEEFTKNLEAFWASLPAKDQALRQQVIAAEVIEGFPAEVILQQAKKHNCDMIALGAHEQGISHTFLGSVAKRVLRRAEIPTLIVPYKRSS